MLSSLADFLAHLPVPRFVGHPPLLQWVRATRHKPLHSPLTAVYSAMGPDLNPDAVDEPLTFVGSEPGGGGFGIEVLPLSLLQPLEPRLPPDVYRPVSKTVSWKELKRNVWASAPPRSAGTTEEPRCLCTVRCDDRCLNRLEQYECFEGNCPFGATNCGNRPFSTKELALDTPTKKWERGYEVVKMGVKGNGLQATRGFRSGELIVEYTGEMVDLDEITRRLNEVYTQPGAHFYFLDVGKNYSIDSGRKGSLARFVNHSCSPNAEMQLWRVWTKNGPELRVGLFAGRLGVLAGDEITYDYNFDWFEDAVPQQCHCGSANCRGLIGRRPPSSGLRPSSTKEPLVPPKPAEVLPAELFVFGCGYPEVEELLLTVFIPESEQHPIHVWDKDKSVGAGLPETLRRIMLCYQPRLAASTPASRPVGGTVVALEVSMDLLKQTNPRLARQLTFDMVDEPRSPRTAASAAQHAPSPKKQRKGKRVASTGKVKKPAPAPTAKPKVKRQLKPKIASVSARPSLIRPPLQASRQPSDHMNGFSDYVIEAPRALDLVPIDFSNLRPVQMMVKDMELSSSIAGNGPASLLALAKGVTVNSTAMSTKNAPVARHTATNSSFPKKRSGGAAWIKQEQGRILPELAAPRPNGAPVYTNARALFIKEEDTEQSIPPHASLPKATKQPPVASASSSQRAGVPKQPNIAAAKPKGSLKPTVAVSKPNTAGPRAKPKKPKAGTRVKLEVEAHMPTNATPLPSVRKSASVARRTPSTGTYSGSLRTTRLSPTDRNLISVLAHLNPRLARTLALDMAPVGETYSSARAKGIPLDEELLQR